MRWWWVRHGPTHVKAMVGWTDLPADLSDMAALSRLSAHLPHAPLVSSDLRRAVDTGNAIQGRRLRLPHNARLREINFGLWENRTFADVEAAQPTLLRKYWEEPGQHAPPQGESWDQTRARVSSFVDRFDQSFDDIIVVAHMGAILTQVQRATGQSAYTTFAQKIDNLSVTCIEITDENHILRSVNHLP